MTAPRRTGCRRSSRSPRTSILLGGTLWSAWRMRGRPELRDRFLGTLLIAFGATIIAGFGSAFAALGYPVPFSISLLVGICVDVLRVPARGTATRSRTGELTHLPPEVIRPVGLREASRDRTCEGR